jgi:hypothetical protein
MGVQQVSWTDKRRLVAFRHDIGVKLYPGGIMLQLLVSDGVW